MTRGPKNTDRDDPPKGIDDDTDLPPITDDTRDQPSTDELAEYLDSSLEDDFEARTWNDYESGGRDNEEEIFSSDEESWTDEDPDLDVSGFATVDIEEEDGYAQEDDTLSLDEPWFTEEVEHSVVDDGGAEGPVEDEGTIIDGSRWDDLDGWDEADDENILDAMKRLNIALPLGDDKERAFVHRPPSELESSWLGPCDGRVVALASVGGRVVAVGDGVFVLGGDDMLHRVDIALDFEATSIAITRDLAFIGTRRHGLVTMRDGERRLGFSNGWNSLGMTRPPRGQAVETIFRVTGQAIGESIRLIGRDGSGQLFSSSNLGATWSGPLSDGRCLEITAVGGTEELLAAMIIEGEPYLLRSADLARWTEVPIPETVERLIASGEMCLAATGRTMIIASHDNYPSAFVSVDGGRNWLEIDSKAPIGAVAIDPQDPAWIAMATRLPEESGYSVRVSRDGGIMWKTISVCICKEDRESKVVDEIEREHRNLAMLVVKSSPGRLVFLVTPDGVHRLTFLARETSH